MRHSVRNASDAAPPNKNATLAVAFLFVLAAAMRIRRFDNLMSGGTSGWTPVRRKRDGGPEPHAAKDVRIADATRAGHIPAVSTNYPSNDRLSRPATGSAWS